VFDSADPNVSYTPKAGDVVKIYVNLVADQYTVPVANFNVTKETGVNTFTMGNLKFDKDGKVVKNETITGNSTDSVLVKFGESNEYIGLTAAGGTITFSAGGEFSLPVATLLASSNSNMIPVDVKPAKLIPHVKLKTNPEDGGSTTVTGVTLIWQFSKDGVNWTNLSAADQYVYTGSTSTEVIRVVASFPAGYTEQGSSADGLATVACRDADIAITGNVATLDSGNNGVKLAGSIAADGGNRYV